MSSKSSGAKPQSLILFDGVCTLCNGVVNFIIDRDPYGHFVFGALQSDEAQSELRRFRVESSGLSTIVLLEDGKPYQQSSAVLRIARRLSGLWPLLYSFIVIPRPLRDAAYRLIANNRYRWFGQREHCRIPTPDLRRRFLSSGRTISESESSTRSFSHSSLS